MEEMMDEDDMDLVEDDYEDSYPSEEMDGDHDSSMSSAGWGTDEDYGCYGWDD